MNTGVDSCRLMPLTLVESSNWALLLVLICFETYPSHFESAFYYMIWHAYDFQSLLAMRHRQHTLSQMKQLIRLIEHF